MEPKKGAPGLVQQLREAIQGSGQSLYQLSKASGIGRDRLSRFMRGERDLTLEAAEKICNALQLRLTGTEQPEPPARARRKRGEG